MYVSSLTSLRLKHSEQDETDSDDLPPKSIEFLVRAALSFRSRNGEDGRSVGGFFLSPAGPAVCLFTFTFPFFYCSLACAALRDTLVKSG